MQAWETNLKDIVARYQDDGDTELFLKRIEDIGEQIGIVEETAVAEGEVDYDGMKLVGAMFISPKDDSEEKTGLDVHM